MKKLLLLIFVLSGVVFALTDTDSDGVSDDADICPRVYAKTTNGCPALTASSFSVSTNTCINTHYKTGKIIATITPICDSSTKICPKITGILGAQSCDPIFPVIFDASGAILVRGSVYILDYTK